MGNPYFDGSFECTINPFEQYNSNVVNRFTKLIASYSNDQDCIFSGDRVEVTQDSTSEITISSGTLFKDDVFIKLLNDISVDLSDPDYYIGGASFNKTGYYYITIRYVYEKSKPAPRPRVTILTSDQRGLFNDEYILLKVADIHYSSYRWIDSLLDYDPENIANKRVYSKLQLGLVDTIPAFNALTDYGRIIFDLTGKLGYYGAEVSPGVGDWVPLGGSGPTGCTTLNIDQLAKDIYNLASGETELLCLGTSTLPVCIIDQLANLRTYSGAVDENDITPDYTLYGGPYTVINGVNLTSAVSKLDEETEFIRDYIGKTAAGGVMPSYPSTNIVVASSNHTTAIGALDQFSERLRTYTGKPDYTATLPAYSSVTTIASGTALLTAIGNLDLEGSYIRAFIGKTVNPGGTPSSETPTYSSIYPVRSITDAQSLRTAISTLDYSIGYTDLVKVITLGHPERNSATPSLLSPATIGKVSGVIYFDNSIATSVTNIIEGPSGSNSGVIVTLHFSNSFTTIVHGATIQLKGSANFTGTVGAVLTLVRYSNIWYELSRCDRDTSKVVKLIESKHVHVTSQPTASSGPVPPGWAIPISWNNPADTSITFTLASLTTCEFVFSASDWYFGAPGGWPQRTYDSFQWLYARLTVDGTSIAQFATSYWIGGTDNIHYLYITGGSTPNFHWVQDIAAGTHTVKVQFQEDGASGGNLELSERSFSIFKIE